MSSRLVLVSYMVISTGQNLHRFVNKTCLASLPTLNSAFARSQGVIFLVNRGHKK